MHEIVLIIMKQLFSFTPSRIDFCSLAQVSEVGEHEDASKGPGVVNPQPEALAAPSVDWSVG